MERGLMAKREALAAQLIPSEPGLISRLSFTQLAEIIPLPDETQRRFHQIECIRGNWSVRELRRLQPRKPRSAQCLRRLLQIARKITRRSVTGRHPSLHPQQSTLPLRIYPINRAATASDVHAYPEMWDTEAPQRQEVAS